MNELPEDELIELAEGSNNEIAIEREFIEQVREQVRAGIDAPEKDETIPDSAQ